jgi:hypothetical protein
MRGGSSRQNIAKEASYVGQVDRRDLPHLLAYLNHWCLRDEAEAELEDETTTFFNCTEDPQDSAEVGIFERSKNTVTE